MNAEFRVPPAAKSDLTPPEVLVTRLRRLVGVKFELTFKTRTDGSRVRNLVASTLEGYPLPKACAAGRYRIVPPKRKGLPRILREFLDTYIVTTGESYNLQVWNRNPAADSVQITFDDGPPLLSSDVRFAFVRVHPITSRIQTIVVLTPDYIVKSFGSFGKPTVKHQLMISPQARNSILSGSPPILYYPDLPVIRTSRLDAPNVPRSSIHDKPNTAQLLSLARIKDLIATGLIGSKIEGGATKSRGQRLEKQVALLLGYEVEEEELLAGGYPDIRHQALEVKLQDSPTVDLGKWTPQFQEDVPRCPGFTTRSLRYLILLTDARSGKIEGAVLCPGEKLGKHFTFVADTSFKCQRSIPMAFFDRFEGQARFNPAWRP